MTAGRHAPIRTASAMTALRLRPPVLKSVRAQRIRHLGLRNLGLKGVDGLTSAGQTRDVAPAPGTSRGRCHLSNKQGN